MKRIIFGAAVLAVFLFSAASSFSQEQAPAPIYRDGDFWWYRFAGEGV